MQRSNNFEFKYEVEIADKCHVNIPVLKQGRFPKESVVWLLLTIGEWSFWWALELLWVGERQLRVRRGAQMELSWRAQALPAACGSPELNSRELSWRAQLFGSQMIRAQLGPLHAVCFPEHCSVSRSLSWAQLELCLEALPRKPSGRP